MMHAARSELLPLSRTRIVHRTFHGEFWKHCPGTTAGHLCCGYQVLTPVVGCGMYCTYCVLQAYFDDDCQVVYDNLDDMDAEVRRKLAQTERLVRLGTGEFADSLFLEPQTGIASHVAELLAPFPNVLLELKTKSANALTLADMPAPQRTVVGFSLNTRRMIAELETGTAPLTARLEAAAQCVDRGMLVAFHFDPMIHYPGCEGEYEELAHEALDAVGDHSRIAWWSMGGFRCMPELKRLLQQQGRHLPLFSGELILGSDRKYRYFRPLRTAMYRAVCGAVEDRAPATRLYLCMESPEVWRDTGMIARIPRGLPAYLDERAAELLAEAR